MATGHVMMAISLDGFVARPDHRLDWLMKQDTAGEDHGFETFLADIDVLVMGSGSFRTVLGFDAWPYTLPVVVLSGSLTQADIPPELRDRVEISRLDPQGIMALAGQRGWNRLYVDGGAVVRSFLRQGLIRDMQITIVPILIGEGIRLFGDLERDIDLKLTGVGSFASGLTDLHYQVLAPG